MTVEFGVRVTQKPSPSAVVIDIWHKDAQGYPFDFAKIEAGSLDLAIKMALPYLVCAAEGDGPSFGLPINREET